MSSVQRKADLVWDVPESPAKKIYVISHLQVSQIPKITSKKWTGTWNASRMTKFQGQSAKRRSNSKNCKKPKINEMLYLFLWLSGIIGQQFLCYFTSTSIADSENHIKKVNRNLECQQNDNIPRSVCETSVKNENFKNAKNKRNAIFIFMTFRNHRPTIFMLFHIYKFRRFRKSHQKSEPELGMPAEWHHSKASLPVKIFSLMEFHRTRWTSQSLYTISPNLSQVYEM